MQYYIIDTTQNSHPQLFKSVADVVKHLEGTVVRKLNLTRNQYMQNLIDLGYGYDDPAGVTFTQAMADMFNIGVISDGKYIRTNIHETEYYKKYKEQTGH